MRVLETARQVSLRFRVNGLVFTQGLLVRADDIHPEPAVFIRHSLLGYLTLTSDFVLELIDEATQVWFPVTLDQIFTAFLAADENGLGKAARESDLKCIWITPSSPDRKLHWMLPRIPVPGDEGHLVAVDEVLTRVGVPYRIVGGLDSQGHCMGHVTIAVRSPSGARIHLRQAGFLPTAESDFVCIDSRNGWKIRLIGLT